MSIIRELKDYIKINGIADKNIVFYAERSVYYKYFESLIENILKSSKENIIYVSSDMNDNIFTLGSPRIRTFYINKLLKPLLQYLNCKIFVTTMTELGNHNFVRSKANKDIEYIYVFHAVVSTNMMYNEGAFDNYDTIFTVGAHHNKEIREREETVSGKQKRLVNFGYPLLDKLAEKYETTESSPQPDTILIAPSWHGGNILDLCIDDVIANIDIDKRRLIIRPHPEYLKRYEDRFKKLMKKYENSGIIFDTDMLSNNSMYNADLLITDWSGIAYEYAFAALRPVLFINTPKKEYNPGYIKCINQPMEVTLRDKCGESIDIDKLNNLNKVINNFFDKYDSYKNRIKSLRDEYIYNFGLSEKGGAEYIINKLSDTRRK